MPVVYFCVKLAHISACLQYPNKSRYCILYRNPCVMIYIYCRILANTKPCSGSLSIFPQSHSCLPPSLAEPPSPSVSCYSTRKTPRSSHGSCPPYRITSQQSPNNLQSCLCYLINLLLLICA